MTGRLTRAALLLRFLISGKRVYSPLAYACGLLLEDSFQGGPVAWLRGFPRPRIRPGAGAIELGHVALYPGVRLDCLSRGRIAIGDGSYLNRNVRISAGELVSLGRETMVSWDAVLTDAVCAGAGREEVFAPVRLGDRVWIGCRAVILGGTELGEGCVVGAGCVVQGRFPPHTVLTCRAAEVQHD